MSAAQRTPICVLVHHDAHCPGAHGNPLDCCCNPEVRMVSIEELASTMVKDSKRQRAADRETAEAMARARKGGAA